MRSTSVWTLPSSDANARLYGGQRAGGTDVRLELHGEDLLIRDGDQETWHKLGTVGVREPVGRGPWSLSLPDAGSISTSDPAVIDALMAARDGVDLLTALEARWHWAAIALAVTIAVLWGLLTFGLPAAAKRIAYALPPAAYESMSSESLDIMDRLLFEPTLLPMDRQAEIETLFVDITASEAARYQLVFRSSDIGPNAFAIPGGVVLLTDELVELAQSDAELAAVLAHEVGHLSAHHSFRTLLQNSIGAVLIATITGDLTNITALSAAVPTVLLQAKYSRDFEREADRYAFDYLDSKGLPTDALSDLLKRMEDRYGGDDLPEWLSTHPTSQSRRLSE